MNPALPARRPLGRPSREVRVPFDYMNTIVRPLVKFEVLLGFRSRYQHWKFQVPAVSGPERAGGRVFGTGRLPVPPAPELKTWPAWL